MRHIDRYAKKWGREADNNFAAACYDSNSIEELEAPHAPSDADSADCEAWGITPQEWSEAIEAALRDKLDDIIEINNPWSGEAVEIDPMEITQDQLDSYVELMDDDLREELHSSLAPCSPGAFLRAWIERVGPDEAGRVILGS